MPRAAAVKMAAKETQEAAEIPTTPAIRVSLETVMTRGTAKFLETVMMPETAMILAMTAFLGLLSAEAMADELIHLAGGRFFHGATSLDRKHFQPGSNESFDEGQGDRGIREEAWI